ncbi:hypothetical protein BGW42_000605, partial [Actinomortierella wolfii]
MLEHLAVVASKINSMRLDNLRASQGATIKPDNLGIIDPVNLREDVKSAQTLAKAFKSKSRKRSNKQSYSWS